MRTATTIEACSAGNWRETLDYVLEAEKLGLDICWVAEAWGSDAPSPLGYLAARTHRLLLGSGVIQIGTRTPVVIAMTALTLAELSGNRFLLGLGPSGPQVIEGLHGLAFDRPLGRMRETIEVIKQAFAGEKITHAGREFQIPRPEGEGRPMRLSIAPNPQIPIYLASMSPKMLELTGAAADGWLGTSFVPEGSQAYFRHLDAGLATAGRSRSELDVCQGAEVAFLPDEAAVSAHVASRKKELAFSLGGMGSGRTNFYNNAYSRQGWAEIAQLIRERWQTGDRDGAAQLVSDDMVLATTLIGTEPMVRDRLKTWREVGVNTVRLYPAGASLDERLTTLARAIEIVAELSEAGAEAKTKAEARPL
jgi:F420-dependent oxidoreductase-like protein